MKAKNAICLLRPVVRQIRTRIAKAQRLACEHGALRLKESGLFERDVSPRLLRECSDPFGGYKIPEDWIDHIGPKGGEFLQLYGFRYCGYFYSRGSAYYSSDPAIYYNALRPSNVELFQMLIDRWQHYRDLCEVVEEWEKQSKNFPCWLVAISAIEWIMNDLCTLLWVVERLELREQAISIAESLSHVSEVLVSMHFLTPILGKSRSVCLRSIVQRISVESTVFATISEHLYNHPERGIVRSIREGDHTWLAAMAYLERLEPQLRRLGAERSVTFVSNAFGGIHLGHLWKAAARRATDASLASTIVAASSHEHEMCRFDRVNVQGFTEPDCRHKDVVILCDDSYFTGKAMDLMRALVPNGNMYIYAPITFDCATVLNHPEELGSSPERVLESFLSGIARISTENDFLAPARSYWRFKKRAQDTDNEFTKMVLGSDLLLAALWMRFCRERPYLPNV